MPQPDTKVESIGAKTIPGVFIGYHFHPGGLWSGDYLVADLAPFKIHCNVIMSKVKIHRIKEVAPNHSGKFYFPVAYWRKRRLLREYNEEGLTDPEMPDLGEDSGDDDDYLPKPADDLPPPIPVPAEAMPSQDGSLLANAGTVPGQDTRGMGLETFGLRGACG